MIGCLRCALAENKYTVSLNESGEKVYTPKENGADSYTYDTNWKDKLTSYNGQTISYDESGNPTSYLGHNLSWTMGRQLASYDNTTYSYNESGIRTSKTVGENTTEFYLNGTNIIYQTDGTNDIYFFYDRNNEIVGFKYENNNYFYVKNQMGDITDIANENGIIVASYTYDPWGKVTSVSGSNLTVANLNPFRYRSYYYDSDIQMYYLQSRYYDPEVGRFINCDDVNYIGLTESSVSYNPFAYCENEPVNRVDPWGLVSSNPLIQISKFIKSFSKSMGPIITGAKISSQGINMSNFSSRIKKMKNIYYTVSYSKKYELYEITTRAENIKWYYREYYTIVTYSTSVENWYKIYDAVQKKMKNKDIAALVLSALSTISGVAGFIVTGALINKISKLSVIIGAIGFPIEIFFLMASDSASELEKLLRNKKGSTICTFNWFVTHTTQIIGKQKENAVLEYFCKLAYFYGRIL